MCHRILKPLLVFMLFGISSICEAGPSNVNLGDVSRRVTIVTKWGEIARDNPDQTKEILIVIAIGFVVLLVLSAVVMLIKVISLWLWKLIKSMFLGLVVHLPRKLWSEKLFIPLLWRKKLYIPALWASRSKVPWLLQVKKFRRPDIWVSNIPWGLLIINLILWVFDVFLCVCCLCHDPCFLFLLVPMLILTYYLYVGVYWVRIVIIALLVLACPVCGICFGEDGFGVTAYVSVVLIVLLFLPKSNAWFRNQNGNVVDAKSAENIIGTDRHDTMEGDDARDRPF